MDFKDQIKQIAERINRVKDSIQTEEAAKMSMIAPVIQALGYDIFDPLQVVPEFTCDIGIKKGEKIDYALMSSEGHPLILWECKHWKKNLNVHEGQLMRYFAVAKARFSVLTNGIYYRFYADLDRPNLMDEKPFFEFDITNMDDTQIEELKKFSKSYFTVESILETAGEMKNIREIKRIITGLSNEPEDWFIREIAKRVTPNGTTITAKIVETFKPLIKKSFTQIISDTVSDRLKSALQTEGAASVPVTVGVGTAAGVPTETEDDENKIVTTPEEMEGYYAVLASVRKHVDPSRVIHRDSLSYFAILLDDNNRKPICRLHFNRAKKYIEIFDENKVGTKHEIANISDIFGFADAMIASIELYDGKREKSDTPPEEQPAAGEAPEGFPDVPGQDDRE